MVVFLLTSGYITRVRGQTWTRALYSTFYREESTAMTVRSGRSTSTTASIRLIPDPKCLCNLWKAVLIAQMEDAFSPRSITVARVKAWMRSTDFEDVCDLAEVRKDWAEQALKMILTAKSPGEARRYYDSAKRYLTIQMKK